MKFPTAEGLRFLAAGAVNTAATYAIYYGLLERFHYTAAYTIAYVAGILLSYVLNARFVFRVPLSWRGLMAFPLVYAVQYVLGVAVLYAAIEGFGVPRQVALLIVIVVTIPVTFVLSRWVLRRGKTV